MLFVGRYLYKYITTLEEFRVEKARDTVLRALFFSTSLKIIITHKSLVRKKN